MKFKAVVKNAKVVDGNNTEIFLSDVAITDTGRIKLFPVQSKITSDQIFDAEGLFIAPGFIDVHTHDDTNVIRTP